MTEFVPSILDRKVVAKPWGGTGLAGVFGKSFARGEPAGETWELYDRPDGSSSLRDRDATVRDWMMRDGRALLGAGVEASPGGYFPLLIKYVNATEALSVQVHPDREQAARDGDGPKNEAWIVLAAGDDARIVRGFVDGVTLEQVAEVGDRPELVDLLHAFHPKVGDAIDVPAGTVHSIGPDVIVFEVQQNSDLTYRLYDWGRGRELHVESALEALRFGPAEPAVQRPEAIDDNASWVLRTPHFRVRRFAIPEPVSLPTEGTFKIATVVSGRGTLGWRSGGDDMPLMLARGDCVIVPACIEAVFLSSVGEFEVLWTDAGEGR